MKTLRLFLYTVLTLLAPCAMPVVAQNVVYEPLVTFNSGPRYPDHPLVLGSDGNYYGTTTEGGRYGRGTIFQVTPEGGVNLVWEFGAAGSGPANPAAGLTVGPDGALYGTTAGFLPYKGGSVFRYTAEQGVTVLTVFGSGTGEAAGSSPNAELVLGKDNNFYGTTCYGGARDQGTVFRVSLAGQLTTLFSFTGNAGKFRGRSPLGKLAVADDGTIYGTARVGGYWYDGIIWKYTPKNAYKLVRTILHARILYTSDIYMGDLVLGPDKNIYGVTRGDGISQSGSVFRIDTLGRYKRLLNLSTISTGYPHESLSVGADGRIYGCGYDSIFAMSLDGAGQVITRLTGITGDRPGSNPAAPLPVSGGGFVGVGRSGGSYDVGVVYRLDGAGAYSRVADFPGSSQSLVARNPKSRLVFGAGGDVYLATDRGIIRWQASGAASIFSSKSFYQIAGGSDGTIYGVNYNEVNAVGADGSASRVGGSFQDNEGRYIVAPPLEGSDGNLYGVTSDGGAKNFGTIYRTTKDGVRTVLASFTGKTGAVPGREASDQLTEAGDGNFYGVTRSGGVGTSSIYDYGNGTIFRITPSGSYSTLVKFSGTGGNTPGRYPQGPLTLGPDGGLYGISTYGGVNGSGVLFRVSTNGAYTVLANFGSLTNDPRYPAGSVVVMPDGTVYGVSSYGTDKYYGTVFRWTQTDGIKLVFAFTGPGDQPLAGNSPQGLTLGRDGNLYGVCYYGGPGDAGLVYRLHLGPAPSTVAATNVTLTSVALQGTIHPNGRDVDLAFEYGETMDLGQTLAAGSVPAGDSPVPVSASLDSLKEGTTYYYRLVATPTGGGTKELGVILSFTTLNPGSPIVTTGAASAVTLSGATVAGAVNPNGRPTSAVFEYGLDTSYGTTVVVPLAPDDGFQSVTATAAIDGFGPGVEVHYRISATNAIGTSVGSDATFTTGALAPVVVTGSVSDIVATGATLKGTVNPQGNSATAYFEYGLTGSYGQKATVSPAPGMGNTAADVQVIVSGLLPSATYHYRLVATNAGGQTLGDDATFDTPVGVATVEAKPANPVTTSSATLLGTVDPNGTVTTAEFQYGLTASLGSTVPTSPTPGNGRGPVNVHADLTGLAPNSHYYYKLVATNSAGVASSPMREFFTTNDGGVGGGGGGGENTLQVTDDIFFVGPNIETLRVLLNDGSNVDGVRITSYQTAQSETLGKILIKSDGQSLSYSPSTQVSSLKYTDTFTYTATQTGGGTGTAAVNVYYYLGLKGTYAGAVRGSDQISSGNLDVTLTNTGAASGSLRWQGKVYPFRVDMGLYGDADLEFIHLNSTRPNAAVSMRLKMDPANRRITGSLSDTGTETEVTAAIALDGPPFGDQAVIGTSVFTSFISVPNSAAAALEGASEAAGLDLRLRGFGFARVTIGKNNDARFAGRMPDLAPLSNGSKLLRAALTGQLKYNYNQSLYTTRQFTRAGSVSGEVQVSGATALESLLASLDWDRPSVVQNKPGTFYPNGFGAVVRADLSGRGVVIRKRAVPDGFSTNLPNAVLTISDGGLAAPIRAQLDVSKTGTRVIATNPTGIRVTVGLNSSTAFMSGSFVHPITRKAVPFFGARAAAGESSKGTFLGTTPDDGTGSVVVTPQ